MKKNVMMRLASFLLIAVLITTCSISGTYAKYVTSGSGEDSARVAKFGVNVVASNDIFSDTYVDEANGNIAGTTSLTVDSDNGDNVVAPGTKGSMAALSITGTPEVDVNISYAAEVTLNEYWTVDGSFYCPLVFTVKGANGDGTVNGLDFGSAAALKAKLEAVIAEYSKDYDAGTDLSAVSSEYMTIGWEWPFSTSDANDDKDTALGDQAAAGTYGVISIKLTCTVTQID